MKQIKKRVIERNKPMKSLISSLTFLKNYFM